MTTKPRSPTDRSPETTGRPAKAAPLPGLPPLSRDRSFWGMSLTQFLGAFNDNLFKQLMLLLSIPAAASSFTEKDQQGVAMVVFSLPFVLFAGLAGYLSDRYSKTPIIRACKVAEIVIMVLGVLSFYFYSVFGYAGLLTVLFLMGTQSSFFGPGKYGILPEMLRERDLAKANGFILMMTFLAIIFGTVAGGLMGDAYGPPAFVTEPSAGQLWAGCLFCVMIAVVGTATSLMIRYIPAARPELKLTWDALIVPRETRHVLSGDRPLVMALLASCVFWLISGIAIQAVNSLGIVQLGLSKSLTSVLTGAIGLGIAIGGPLAGFLCRGRVDFRLVRIGMWGLAILLLLMAISLPGGRHLLGFGGSLPTVALLGVSAALFAIPVQVFVQARPPEGMKGRMIAFMNQINSVALLLSGVLYASFDRLVESMEWPRSVIFAMMAVLLLPMLILYRPRNEDAEDGPDAADAVI